MVDFISRTGPADGTARYLLTGKHPAASEKTEHDLPVRRVQQKTNDSIKKAVTLKDVNIRVRIPAFLPYFFIP